MLVDADNAFNSIKREKVIREGIKHWPAAARFVINTYGHPTELILQDCETSLWSCEGVVQGDPISMMLYSLASMPLIETLQGKAVMISLKQTFWFIEGSSILSTSLSFL
eukprot:GHVN01104720.1.p1 GENE.GHVN01104720.1~~GHVN01104720.1.p1  ORF type:complete len:109 (-),score=13.82 GHVN01104720.1:762-1088(-)